MCACQAASGQASGSNKGRALSVTKPGFSPPPVPFCAQHRPPERGYPRVQLLSRGALWGSSVWPCTGVSTLPGPPAEGEGLDVRARGGARVLLPAQAVPPFCARTLTPESSDTHRCPF